MKYFIDKIQGHWQNDSTWGRRWPSGSHHLCTPCGWSSSWQGSFFFSPEKSFKSLWDLWQWDISCPLRHGDACEAGRVLKPWESAAGALESLFLGVALVESLWLPSPPPPLPGLLSEPVAYFLAMNPMHTFLWLCKAEDETKACFRHFPQP